MTPFVVFTLTCRMVYRCLVRLWQRIKLHGIAVTAVITYLFAFLALMFLAFVMPGALFQ